jgi:hypothetical protein
MATFQLFWWRKTSGALPCIISGTNGHLTRTTDVPKAMFLSGFEPTAVRGKWFKVNNLNHSATDVPQI